MYRKEFANWKLSPLNIEKTSLYHKHIFTFPLNNNSPYPISDDWLKLIGAFVSDGTLSFRDKEKTDIKSWRTTQSLNGKTEFFEMMDSLTTIQKERYDYEKETVWTGNKTDATLLYELCGHYSNLKHLPYWYVYLSKEQARTLLYALMLGDGTFEQANSRSTYYTINKRLAYEVCTLALLAGYESNVLGGDLGYSYEERDRGIKDTPMFHVSIKNRELAPHWVYLKDGKNIKEIAYNGNVVCFEVPNGTLVTMCNGKVATQGNCKQLHHIVRCEEFLRRYITGVPYAECLIPTDTEHLINIKSQYIYSLEEARELADACEQSVRKVKQHYMDTHDVVIDNEINAIMNDVLINVLKESFKKELL